MTTTMDPCVWVSVITVSNWTQARAMIIAARIYVKMKWKAWIVIPVSITHNYSLCNEYFTEIRSEWIF